MKWKNLLSETCVFFITAAIEGWRPLFLEEQARALGIASVRALNTKINYIHENPVRRQLVSSPSEWLWSSWRNYEEDDDSILRVDREALASAI